MTRPRLAGIRNSGGGAGGQDRSGHQQCPALDERNEGPEYGCGTGLVGLALAPQLLTLTAVDTSSGMLEVLTRKIASDNISNVTLLRLDLLTEPLAEKFDLIFAL